MQGVVARATEKFIVAETSPKNVGAGVTVDLVISGAPHDDVVAGATEQQIVSSASHDLVHTAASAQHVIPLAAVGPRGDRREVRERVIASQPRECDPRNLGCIEHATGAACSKIERYDDARALLADHGGIVALRTDDRHGSRRAVVADGRREDDAALEALDGEGTLPACVSTFGTQNPATASHDDGLPVGSGYPKPFE
jgi:hypothetical protein